VFVLKHPTFVIDDAHTLMNDNRQSFDKLIQLLREPVCQRGAAKVILLSSEMDFEDIVRKNGTLCAIFPFVFALL
jgi:hypothetical protein